VSRRGDQDSRTDADEVTALDHHSHSPTLRDPSVSQPSHGEATAEDPRGILRVGAMVGDGKYRLDEALGEGGMGSVYAATQLESGRAVAIKFLHPEILANEQLVKRFNREAAALSQISHPNVVRVFEFGIDPELQAPFLVLELIRGRTLRAIVRETGPMSERRTKALLVQAARPLIEMHAKGMVHRDLKPENCMVETLPDGTEHLKILDFGLAKLLLPDTTGKREEITTLGAMLGTPAYMAPEQAVGAEIDGRADLYALGCILHFLLTGVPPYVGPTSLSIVTQHVSTPIPPLPIASDGLPIGNRLRALHAALLSKSREDRPLIAEVLEALSGDARPGPRPAPVPPRPRISNPPPRAAIAPHDTLPPSAAKVRPTPKGRVEKAALPAKSPLRVIGIAAMILALIVAAVVVSTTRTPTPLQVEPAAPSP